MTPSTSITRGYTVERITSREQVDDELLEFFKMSAEQVAMDYGHKFNWKKFKLLSYARDHRLMICRRNGRPVGIMLSQLYGSVFDPDVKILCQDLLFTKPGTRAARLLMRDFIDFGRLNANHVITMIAEKTNIKRQSLEKLGFVKLEELYRIEV